MEVIQALPQHAVPKLTLRGNVHEASFLRRPTVPATSVPDLTDSSLLLNRKLHALELQSAFTQVCCFCRPHPKLLVEYVEGSLMR